jgi:hypothetical protein
MASNAVRVVAQQLSAQPLKDIKSVVQFLEREAKPLMIQAREAINAFMPAPRLPIHAAAPVTDDVVDPLGRNPPKDGYVSISSVDGKLYYRNGSSTHVAVVA